jgi:hypothetical protein
MSEIILRLMRKVDDGYEEVGYAEFIMTATGIETFHSKELGGARFNIKHNPNLIPHNRIDRWTGLKYPDGRLVFERDKVITKQGAKGCVIFKEYMFKVVIPEWIGKHGFRHIYRENTLLHARGMGIAFLGIEGAAKEQQSSKSAKETT